MASPRLLVAGVGHLLRSDDAFASQVLRRLLDHDWPAEVRLVDYGVGGIHLVNDVLAGPRVLILVTTVAGEEPAGRVSISTLEREHLITRGPGTPSLRWESIFPSIEALGGRLPRTLLVGCTAASLETGMGLSPVVDAAVEPAADQVRQLVIREHEALAGAPLTD